MPATIIGKKNFGYSMIFAIASTIQDDKLELLAKKDMVINKVIFDKFRHPILSSITRK